MRYRATGFLSILLATLYTVGLIVDRPAWLRGVTWTWARKIPDYWAGRSWMLIALALVWLILLFLAIRSPRNLTSWKNALFVTVAALLATLCPLIIAAQQRSQPLALPFLTTISPDSGFYEEGITLEDPGSFIAQHASNMKSYRGVHLSTQPPGWPVAFWAATKTWERFPNLAKAVALRLRRTDCTSFDLHGLTPPQIAAATLQMGIILISGLGAAVVYLLAQKEFSAYEARIASLVYAMIPGLIVFQSRVDALYAVCAVAALLFARAAFVDRRRSAAVLLALLLAGLTFFAFGPLIIIPLIDAYLLALLWTSERRWSGMRRLLAINAYIVLAIVLLWAGFWLAWKASWPEMLLTAQQVHRSVRAVQPLWPLFNLYDLAVFAGIPLLLWAVAGGFAALRRFKTARRRDALFLGWLSFVIIFDLTGIVQAETGRIWLFLAPVAALLAVASLVEYGEQAGSSSTTRDAISMRLPVFYRAQTVIFLILSLFGIQALVTGLFLADDVPVDVTPQVQWRMPKAVQHVDYALGEAIALRGFSVDEGGSDSLTVSLVWQATGTPAADYSAFVHLYDSDGNLIANNDHVPMDGALPTWCWLKGEFITDSHMITLVSGDYSHYSIGAGMYDWRNGERLPVEPAVPDNVIPLSLTK